MPSSSATRFPSEPPFRLLVPVAVAVWTVINFTLVYQQFLLPKGPLHWDEASHALQGMIMASDVKGGDIPALLYDSYRQVYWPPAFSWISGTLFALAGASTETARLSSLIWTLPLPAVLFLAGSRLLPARSWLAGLLAAGLGLTSASLADAASYAMLEAPGLLAMTVGLWLYLRFIDRPSVLGAVLLGLALMGTYLTKSSYGVLLVLAVLLERLVQSRLHLRAAFWDPPARYGSLTLAAALLVWFAYPAKIRNSWTALVNSPYGGIDPYALEGLLYYPRSLATLIGPAWLLSVALLALAATLTRLTHPKLRFLVLLVCIQMAFATWSATKLERHIITMLPPLFLLTAYWVAWLASRLWRRKAWAASVAASLLPFLLLGGSSQDFYREVFSRPAGPPDREAFAVVQHLAGLERRAGPMLVAGSNGVELPPPQMDWYLTTQGGMSVWNGGSVQQHQEGQWRFLLTLPRPLAAALGRLLERGGGQGETRSLYSGFPLEAPQLATEESYAAGIVQQAMAYQLPSVAVVQTREGAAYYQKGLVERELLAGGYKLAESSDFPQAAAAVRLYVRDRPIRPPL